MVAQVIDDTVGHTLVSASDIEAELAGAEGTKTDKARKVGSLIAERAKLPVSPLSCSTAVVTSTQVALRPLPRRP